ncbi:hypothetical protein PIB30_001538 [Stylosanthes scabra]|uniref:Leucine-rich repeat-containing N-terminal plant-type domain-containing protein n=1 Tax=Stylosanthes scabra TaxID=79078 RepID=A0ABU6R2N1_9FABA|nr:hypothetical protein [Stylosanthes scabra]
MNNLNPVPLTILIEALLLFITVMLLQVDNFLVFAAAGTGGGGMKCAERERHALLEFKAAMVDDYGMLSSWNGPDCCHWKGVHCSNLTGHVTALDLHGDSIINAYTFQRQFLRGKIPSSLVELHHLRYLNLSSNDFEDYHIPEFFGNFTSLRYLDLSFCYFGGRIPSQLGSLSHLTYLNLGFNRLEGSIPFQLGNLSKLQYLDFTDNLLEGTIPSQLGNLSTLHELHLNMVGALKIEDDGNGVAGQWLSSLTSLTYLNLDYVLNLNNSYNWILGISNISTLTELSLYSCGISDHFMLSRMLRLPRFKFPNSLSVLDLGGNTFTSSPILFQWLSNVTSNLLELDLSFSLLGGFTSKPYDITMQSLERLELSSYNQIKDGDLKSFANICTLSSLTVFHGILTKDLESILHNLSAGCVTNSLQELVLSNNQITGSIPDLSMFPSLKTLSLFGNQLRGKLPDNIRLPSQLESLSFGSNYLEGGIPKSFGNTCSLESLDLSYNNLTGEFPVAMQHLSGCARYSLQYLNLRNNQFNGTLPDISILPNLKALYLSENKLNGKVPEEIQFPSQLETLIMNSNSLEGVITESRFHNLSKLKVLDLSGNSFVLKFNHDWIPPFQLQVIMLQQCMLGPYLPKWLQTQKYLMQLDISNAGISDITPKWFWAISKRLDKMNISYNNLTGLIPDLPLRFTEYPSISLAVNHFEGRIPVFFRRAESLDLSSNKFSDLAFFVCSNGTAERLGQLDISDNILSGQIPNCWSNFKSLAYIDVSNNNFSGQVPTSMGLAVELRVLILRNNNFSGELPISLKNCTNLVMLDAGENKLSGIIPPWIGSSLQQLQMLSLRKNIFFGSVPSALCSLTGLYFLDLSVNHIKGQIPKCFKNFNAMAHEEITSDSEHHYYSVPQIYGFPNDYDYDIIAMLMWKGAEQNFKNDKLLLKGIDLSSNQLLGDIPSELVNLVGLVSLNLSRNNLTGRIPWDTGRLVSLDFLDLSRNHLFGSIPSSLAKINRLSMLDLSHNNLSGMIPIGTQLQSFNATSYEENQGLCGLPLEKLCFVNEPHQEPLAKTQKDEHDDFIQAFFISMGLGFFVGFWGIFGTILFNRSCRHAYFRFVNNLTEKVVTRWHY